MFPPFKARQHCVATNRWDSCISLIISFLDNNMCNTLLRSPLKHETGHSNFDVTHGIIIT